MTQPSLAKDEMIMTAVIRHRKTFSDLLSEFEKRYTTDEIYKSVDLQTLRGHLVRGMSFSGGITIPTPAPYLQDLYTKYLNYKF